MYSTKNEHLFFFFWSECLKQTLYLKSKNGYKKYISYFSYPLYKKQLAFSFNLYTWAYFTSKSIQSIHCKCLIFLIPKFFMLYIRYYFTNTNPSSGIIIWIPEQVLVHPSNSIVILLNPEILQSTSTGPNSLSVICLDS